MESTTTTAMETTGDTNWRRDAGDRLRRLHSLLFGAELALDRGEADTARTLSLRLLGFLDSQTGDESADQTDSEFVKPIRTEAASKLAVASRLLAPDSDSQAFHKAGKEVGCVFVKKGDVDLERIKNSKCFQALLRNPKRNSDSLVNDVSANCKPPEPHIFMSHLNRQSDSTQLDLAGNDNAKLFSKASRLMTQAKLTSIYNNKPSKPNIASCKDSNTSLNISGNMDIDTETRSYQNDERGNQNGMENERQQGLSGLKQKRRHKEFTSPISERANSPSSNDEAEVSAGGFVTAKAKLELDNRQRFGSRPPPNTSPSNEYNNTNMRNYGIRPGGFNRRGPRGNFVPPIRNNSGNTRTMAGSRMSGKGDDDGLEDSTRKCMEMLCGPDGKIPDKLKNIEPRLIEHISNEIMEKDPNVRWSDIAGLEHAKKCVMEMAIYPLLRPDIFRGCRSPGRGLLLFGPPGTGKTMIGKAIAGEAKATFFYISASSLTSKWIGEGEKLVRALFGVASCRQPAVIFVDEIDSLLSQRKSEGEHESSRRIKTQFLIEMEGFDSGNDQILLIGATNRPQELDEAARRRLARRLYIPLPSSEARACIIRTLLEKDGLLKLSPDDVGTICRKTEGYSGSDMKNLVKDACMGPLREALMQGTEIIKLKKEDLRPVNLRDFEDSLQEIRPSVALSEIAIYEEWNQQFGSSKNEVSQRKI
ncbi:P-loop containing nucleoside triphosphate hydrolases superfamily protein [Rhynchospora pubera]|uniref:P-loop containing nucleoside triphosphate hydrolases superfamily protein n=1 Tax=Rhynchospora pubera TaxID=906938 RepID=A0AAV8DDY7_9POAL|nr:P-loop containing nucleoside triphosphate hydrolases superfamily protein [Rhynchospora pubera]